MPRHVRQDDQGFGSDSFMDVVANVVGILIVLLIVVGLRVKNAPPDDGAAPLAAELSALRSDESSLNDETARQRSLAESLDRQRYALDDENRRLAEQLAAREAERLAGRDRAERQRSDLERQVAEAASYLELLEADAADARAAAPSAERIDSYPTPLAQTVLGEEAHFQLRGGRVVAIPLDDLIAQLRSDATQQIWKLRDLPEATDTIGPVDGFRLRYTMQRFDVSLGEVDGRRRAGSYAELTQWTLIPVSDEMGETLDEALAEGSKFRAAVARLDPLDTTVTIWTYADSFAEFRNLKGELYRQGFATACRPLPDRHPISGSPDGSKSAAQ